MDNRLRLTSDANPNYLATICRIGEVFPIEGADRLVKTVVNGYDIVISKDYVPGDIVVYFPVESVISSKYLSANNLYEMGEFERNANADEVKAILTQAESLPDDDTEGKRALLAQAKAKCGFFNKHGRVRILKLRGQYSQGFIAKVDTMLLYDPSLSDVDWDSMVGVQFNYVDDDEFSKKYIPTIKNHAEQHGKGQSLWKNRMKKLRRFDRIIPGQFEYHYDTKMLQEHIRELSPDDIVSITVKVHGCVEANTVVDTREYGQRTIGWIVDNKIDCHVLSFDIDNHRYQWAPVMQFHCIPNDGDWFRIELENGKEIKITGNNPVWLPDEKVYRAVEDLVGNENIFNKHRGKCRIKSVTRLDEKYDRYDLTVPLNNNFFTNGILIHNTSAIFANILCNRKLSTWEKVKKFFGFKVKEREYGNVYSSRSVIKNQYINPNAQSFYGSDIWGCVNRDISKYIPEGMAVYGEIVGYIEGTKQFIQKGYDYGCKEGTWKFMPYRITITDDDGNKTEWDVDRVNEWTLNLMETAPEISEKLMPMNILYYGRLGDLYPDLDETTHWHESLLERLKNDRKNFLMEENEPMCRLKAPREGIVIRKVGDSLARAWKLKTNAHFNKECKEHDAGNADIEEIS